MYLSFSSGFLLRKARKGPQSSQRSSALGWFLRRDALTGCNGAMVPPKPQVNVALLGFGNVGRAFARHVEANSDAFPLRINIRAVADSSGALLLSNWRSFETAMAHKSAGRRLADFAREHLIADAPDFIRTLPSAGISLLIEALPTDIISGEPALSLIKIALEQGTDVVTVDKGPVVHGLNELNQIASKSGARLGYSGTTGVTIPDEIAGNRVLEIRGVLNGTTNYILTEMQQHNRSFDDALATAQVEGIAEPDSSLDIEGWDTASKILILAKSLMRASSRLDQVSRIGIGPQTESLIQVARKSGRVVRLAGRARIWQGRVRVSVAPKLIEIDSPFYAVSGTSKAAIFRTEEHGPVLSLSRSGRDAISQTILEDIVRTSRQGETV
jgi:homoserine dehydrogenase